MQKIRNILIASAASIILAACSTFSAKAQSMLQDGTTMQGHLVRGNPIGSPGPTGTNLTITAGSTDFAGSGTATSTAPVTTFGKAFNSTPLCLLIDLTTPADAVNAVVSATAITWTTTGSTDKLQWACFANPGN